MRIEFISDRDRETEVKKVYLQIGEGVVNNTYKKNMYLRIQVGTKQRTELRVLIFQYFDSRA